MKPYTMTVDIQADGNSARFDEFTDRVLDAMAGLEELDPGISDADITASLATLELSVTMTVAADSARDATRIFLANVRTALHAAGGATPGWPSVRDWALPEPRNLDVAAA